MQPIKEDAAQFYRQLVGLDDRRPKWGPNITRPSALSAATSGTGTKEPPRFRSAGMVDLSDPNDVGECSTTVPAYHGQLLPEACQQGQPAPAKLVQPVAEGFWASRSRPRVTLSDSAVDQGLDGNPSGDDWCSLQGSQSFQEEGVQGLTYPGLGSQHYDSHDCGHQIVGERATINQQEFSTRGGRKGVEVLQPRQPGSHQHQYSIEPGERAGVNGVFGPRQARRAAAERRLASGEVELAKQLSSARERSASDHANLSPAVQFPTDSIGYKLLKAAGWKPGAGLGTQEQGIAEPIEAERNPGTRGVGFTKGLQVGQPQQHQALQQQSQQSQLGKKRSALLAGIIRKELACESTEAKVAHQRAAEESAAEAARNRALQRALFAAFNDPFDNAGAATANCNPLSRPNRLTATNPLLGSDSD